jgi:hypothetical protein
MGENALRTAVNPAINEGVFLLNSLSPVRLENLRRQYPHLSDDLKLGIPAGAQEDKDKVQAAIIREKAQIMIAALAEAEAAADRALASVSQKIKSARRQRLFAQLLVLIGSSSSLATLAFGKNPAAIICAMLTLFAAIGSLIADYKEKLLNPQTGNIYDAYQRLSEGAYRTRKLSTDLSLALKYNQGPSELEPLVASANVLCEDLNGWLIQMVATTARMQPKSTESTTPKT